MENGDVAYRTGLTYTGLTHSTGLTHCLYFKSFSFDECKMEAMNALKAINK